MIDQLKNQFSKAKPRPEFFSIELKSFMYNLADQYGFSKFNIKQIFHLLKHNFTFIPECELENCTNSQIFNKLNVLTSGCCMDHTRKINNLKKYGVDNVSKLDEIKNKIKSTSLARFGVEFPMQQSNIKEKFKKTSLEKYGVSNPSQDIDVQLKVETTNMKRYGVRRPIQNQEIFDKMKQTNLFKYQTETITGSDYFITKSNELFGVDNPMQNSDVRKKAELTNIKRYGGVAPNSSPIIFEKQQKSCFRRKEFIWKSGEISIVQGFEPEVLADLENTGYCFEDVITENSKMPDIWYVFNGKKSRYYPDFYIPKENLIIEVKSQYTLDCQWDRNQAKFKAVTASGFNFKLIVK